MLTEHTMFHGFPGAGNCAELKFVFFTLGKETD
jgi:hypothetical protein